MVTDCFDKAKVGFFQKNSETNLSKFASTSCLGYYFEDFLKFLLSTVLDLIPCEVSSQLDKLTKGGNTKYINKNMPFRAAKSHHIDPFVGLKSNATFK